MDTMDTYPLMHTCVRVPNRHTDERLVACTPYPHAYLVPVAVSTVGILDLCPQLIRATVFLYRCQNTVADYDT